MGKLITVQDAAKRLGVNPQTIKNWAKDGTLKLKGMGKASRAFWVDEDAVKAIMDDASEIESMKEEMKQLREELYTKNRELKTKVLRIRQNLRIASIGSDRFRMTEFLKSFVWAMSFIGCLKPREEIILKELIDGKSLDSIADKFGISTARVLQVFYCACRRIGEHGNLKNYVVEAEDAKRDLEQAKRDNECMAVALSRYKKWQDAENGYDELKETYGEEFDEEYKRLSGLCEVFSKRLVDLDLTVRSLNICKAHDIDTIGDICKLDKTDLLKFRNFGRKSLTELDDLLEGLGLEFNMDVDDIMATCASMKMMIEMRKSEKEEQS